MKTRHLYEAWRYLVPLAKGNRQGGVPVSAQMAEDPSACGTSPW